MFNENSIVVEIWVRNISEGEVTVDEIPNLSNLRDVVITILKAAEEA